jgi:hypothetical protein
MIALTVVLALIILLEGLVIYSLKDALKVEIGSIGASLKALEDKVVAKIESTISAKDEEEKAEAPVVLEEVKAQIPVIEEKIQEELKKV